MTLTQQIITVGVCVLATVLCRSLPFIVFSSKRTTPKYVQYLGSALPSSVFAMLVIYCLKDVNLLSGAHGIPELICIALTASVHLWRRNMMLSISSGTLAYMLITNLFL